MANKVKKIILDGSELEIDSGISAAQTKNGTSLNITSGTLITGNLAALNTVSQNVLDTDLSNKINSISKEESRAKNAESEIKNLLPVSDTDNAILAWNAEKSRGEGSDIILSDSYSGGIYANTVRRLYPDKLGYYQSMVNNARIDDRNSDYQYRMNFDSGEDNSYIDVQLSKTGSVYAQITGNNAFMSSYITGEQASLTLEIEDYAPILFYAVGDAETKTLDYAYIGRTKLGGGERDGVPLLYLYNKNSDTANKYGLTFDCSRNQFGYITEDDEGFHLYDVNYVPLINSDGSGIYAHAGESQFELTYSTGETPLSIAQRDENGNIIMTAPQTALAGVNKQYADSNYVDLSTNQTIVGEKHFSAGNTTNANVVYYSDGTVFEKKTTIKAGNTATANVVYYEDATVFEGKPVILNSASKAEYSVDSSSDAKTIVNKEYVDNSSATLQSQIDAVKTIASSAVQKDENGNIIMTDPQTELAGVNKQYADANYVSCLNTAGSKLYAHDGESQSEVSYGVDASANSVVQRDDSGNVNMTDPKSSLAGVNKQYAEATFVSLAADQTVAGTKRFVSGNTSNANVVYYEDATVFEKKIVVRAGGSSSANVVYYDDATIFEGKPIALNVSSTASYDITDDSDAKTIVNKEYVLKKLDEGYTDSLTKSKAYADAQIAVIDIDGGEVTQ